jgi:hypothetical protein
MCPSCSVSLYQTEENSYFFFFLEEGKKLSYSTEQPHLYTVNFHFWFGTNHDNFRGMVGFGLRRSTRVKSQCTRIGLEKSIKVPRNLNVSRASRRKVPVPHYSSQ